MADAEIHRQDNLAALPALLDRVRALGLELVDVKQAPPDRAVRCRRPVRSPRAVSQPDQRDELQTE